MEGLWDGLGDMLDGRRRTLRKLAIVITVKRYPYRESYDCDHKKPPVVSVYMNPPARFTRPDGESDRRFLRFWVSVLKMLQLLCLLKSGTEIHRD